MYLMAKRKNNLRLTKTLLLLKLLSANKKATANSGFEGRLKLN